MFLWEEFRRAVSGMSRFVPKGPTRNFGTLNPVALAHFGAMDSAIGTKTHQACWTCLQRRQPRGDLDFWL
jgi:hypothetical protein